MIVWLWINPATLETTKGFPDHYTAARYDAWQHGPGLWQLVMVEVPSKR